MTWNKMLQLPRKGTEQSIVPVCMGKMKFSSTFKITCSVIICAEELA